MNCIDVDVELEKLASLWISPLKTLQVSATPNYAADVEFKVSINHLTLNDHHLDPLRTNRPVNSLWDAGEKKKASTQTARDTKNQSQTVCRMKNWSNIITACLLQPSLRALAEFLFFWLYIQTLSMYYIKRGTKRDKKKKTKRLLEEKSSNFSKLCSRCKLLSE